MNTGESHIALARWVRREHPELYAVAVHNARRIHYSHLGALGDDLPTDAAPDSWTPPVELDPLPAPDLIAPDMTNLYLWQPDPINFDPGMFDAPTTPLVQQSTSAAASPAFWSTVVNQVGSLATQYFKTQQTQAAAQLSTAVINTQLARANAGQSPAPITYVRNPSTGAIQAMVATGSGAGVPYYAQQPLYNTYPSVSPGAQNYVPLTAQSLASLTPQTIAGYLPWIAAGALALFLLSR
jgi:hypothetical protein